ncbi:hypothetical protein, partial [Bosea sp. (in: a-proteobacteria)]|uniref:hypothetical protein n=1 Tax=Bosea sp. (in: a-proteobacteria) TaxID=1871050 RepID=UPI0025BEADF4
MTIFAALRRPLCGDVEMMPGNGVSAGSAATTAHHRTAERFDRAENGAGHVHLLKLGSPRPRRG